MPAQVVPLARRGQRGYSPRTPGRSLRPLHPWVNHTERPRDRLPKRPRPMKLACPGLRPPFGR